MGAGSTTSNLHLPSGVSVSALGKALIFTALLLGLLLTRLDSYLLFHSLAEIFSIVVAFAVFIVAWNSHNLVKNNYLLILGVGSLFIGLIETLHTLGYQGMALLTTYGATLSSQIWIAARFMQAATLLIAPFFLHRRLSKNVTVLVYAGITALLLASILAWRVFPITFVEGAGLTPFKVISEYIIISILLGAAGLLWYNRSDFDPSVLRLLLGSIVAIILGEFAFTLYTGLQDPVNVAGHLLYITGFYLLYLAVVETGFTQPYSLLFHQLKQESDARFDQARTLSDLQASELDAIFSSMTDAVVLYALDGSIVRTNEAADRFFGQLGIAFEMPIDRRVRQFNFLWEDGAPVDKTRELPVQRALQGETVHNVVLGVPIAATGEITWLANGAAPVYGPAGDITGAVLTFRDITQRKVAQEEVQRLNKELERRVIDRTAQMHELRAAWLYARSLIEASLDPLVTIGPNGKITDVNHATEAITGVERKQLIGDDFSDYFTDPDKAREGYEKVLLEGLVRDYPLTVRHVSGKTTNVLYNATLYRNEAGEVQGIFAAARDITELEKSEEARRSAALYARSLIESSLDPLVTISPEGKITDVNHATELVTGVKRPQLVGKDFADYFTEPARARQGYQKVLREGLVRGYPLTIRHVSGKTTDVLYNATVYRNDAGEIQGVFAAARDISELELAEVEIRKLNQDREARHHWAQG